MLQTTLIAALAVMLLTSCSLKPVPVSKPEKPAASHDVIVTVVNAELQGKKPSGEPWDDPKGLSDMDKLWDLAKKATISTVANHLMPGVGGTVAGKVMLMVGPVLLGKSGQDADTRSPDPFVRIRLGKQLLATSVYAETSLPRWEQPLLIRAGETETTATVSVIDVDVQGGSLRDDPMGTSTVSAATFFRHGLITLGPFGSVKKLVMKVEPYLPRNKANRKGLKVPATRVWTNTGTQVIAGQTLTVQARGKICVAFHQGCRGPDGRPLVRSEEKPGWATFSLVKGRPHGGLLVRVGNGAPAFVGRGATVRLVGSGKLRFGINDINVINNQGAFIVDYRLE